MRETGKFFKERDSEAYRPVCIFGKVQKREERKKVRRVLCKRRVPGKKKSFVPAFCPALHKKGKTRYGEMLEVIKKEKNYSEV